MGLFIKQTGSGFTFSTPKDEQVLVVGLGNVGERYQKTRHNIGFVIIDNFARKLELSFKEKKNLDCDLAETKIDGKSIILIKPTTMMNISGRAVQKVAHFYKLRPDNVIVVHDELDLDFGDIRTKIGGGSAGHNGIKSITNTIGPDFHRLRVGIGSERDAKFETSDFVLGNFSQKEAKAAESQIVPNCVNRLEQMIEDIK